MSVLSILVFSCYKFRQVFGGWALREEYQLADIHEFYHIRDEGWVGFPLTAPAPGGANKQIEKTGCRMGVANKQIA